MKEKKFSVYRKLRILYFWVMLPIVALNLLMIQSASVRIRRQGTEKMEVQLASKVRNFDNEIGRINSGLRFHVLNGEEAFLATNYELLSSYQLGQTVAEVNARLNELALLSEYIEDVIVYLPQVERSVSLLKYYDDRISEADMERILEYRYEDNGNIYDNGKLRIHIVAPTSGDKRPLYIMEAELSGKKILSAVKGEAEDELYALAGPDWLISESDDDEGLKEAAERIRSQEEESGGFCNGQQTVQLPADASL